MTLPYTPREAFSSGEYLRDELDERGRTVTGLAEIVGRPVHTMEGILDAKRSITAGTARSLSGALGTSAELWLNLETAYRRRRLALK